MLLNKIKKTKNRFRAYPTHQAVQTSGSTAPGGASAGRSYAYAGVDFTEIRRCSGGWVDQGQKSHSHCPELLGALQELHWHALLGRGYFVSTVGADETTIREYIQKQEKEDARLGQLGQLPVD